MNFRSLKTDEDFVFALFLMEAINVIIIMMNDATVAAAAHEHFLFRHSLIFIYK